jgi:hypothetical protein
MNVRVCENAQTPKFRRALGSSHIVIPELRAMRPASFQLVFDSYSCSCACCFQPYNLTRWGSAIYYQYHWPHSRMIQYDKVRANASRSRWRRGLRHELSSLTRTLGSWVRIPFKAWMSVSVYSVFVLFCVDSGLATSWSPFKESYRLCIRLRNWKSGQGPTKDCTAIDR